MSVITTLARRGKIIVGVGVLFAFIGLGVSLVFPLEYRADAGVLIVPKTRFGVDPYTVVKSAERVGDNLAAVMKTDDFRAKVKSLENTNLNWGTFDAQTPREQRRLWPKMVSASVGYGTGVLYVSAYNTDPVQAAAFAAAAAETLATKGFEYVGGDMVIRVVDNPVVTPWPVRPNIPVNMALGFVVGALIMSVIVVRNR